MNIRNNGFTIKDLRLANSFSRAFRAVMMFASFVTDEKRKNKSILEQQLSYWGQKHMIMHFLQFADQGMKKDKIMKLFEITFDITGLGQFLQDFPNQRLHTFYAGVYGELYSYLTLKETGAKIQLANEEGEESGVDLIVSPSNSNEILVQVKATQFTDRSEYFQFDDVHRTEDTERFKLFVQGLPKNTRKVLKKAFNDLIETATQVHRDAGFMVVSIPPKIPIERSEGDNEVL